MPRPKSQALNDRAQHLLKTLVECYITDGQPVGSQHLLKSSGLEVSPATVRNVMAELEAMGLVQAPHTSAGRVPTVQGYRLFVSSLLTVRPLDRHAVSEFRQRLDPDLSPHQLAETAGSLLSGLSGMAAVVTLPRREHLALRQVEFLPLSEQRALAILVVNDREVHNRIIHTGRAYTAAELQQAANYLNAEFAGRDLVQVREKLLAELRDARVQADHLMRFAIHMAEQAIQPLAVAEADDVLLAGQQNLLGPGQTFDLERLRQLFQVFNQKRELLRLLDQCVQGTGVQVYIGGESGYRFVDECSLVGSQYEVDGRVCGMLGVIGPARMAYQSVIPMVDLTAKLLGAALNQRGSSPS